MKSYFHSPTLTSGMTVYFSSNGLTYFLESIWLLNICSSPELQEGLDPIRFGKTARDDDSLPWLQGENLLICFQAVHAARHDHVEHDQIRGM